ncbi:MAG: sugar phosphate isomerase/epimerase [Bacteroidales bacterium]|nr:sugar phosphate isomerase/epimerase [Bacteroidales bacterium]
MKSFIVLSVFAFILSLNINAQQFRPGFFCFEDAFLLSPGYSFDSQAELLASLGFDGIELEGLDNTDEKLMILDKYKLKVFMVYVQIDIDKEQPYDIRLNDFIKKVKDRDVTLWLHIHSDKFGPSDPSGDELCVPIIRKLADFANQYNVKIALYPHSRFWLEKAGDGVRLTQKIDRKNTGAVFNLCHFLKTDDRNSLEKRLKESIPYLAAVSVNGADDGITRDMEWSRLIQPLGNGSFDVLNILRILKINNYKGPVGLQCYDIKGDPSEFLTKSMGTWQNYLKELSVN